MAASSSSAILPELQSFTDANFSQGRCVAALQWVPARKVQAHTPGLNGPWCILRITVTIITQADRRAISLVQC